MNITGNKNADEVSVTRDDMEQLLRCTIQKGGRLSLAVTGYSMYPALAHQRDRVVLKSPAQYSCRKLDVVFYKREDGRYVLHRIIRLLPDGCFLMNGDAQCSTEVIRPEQIMAVACELERRGRRIACDSKGYRFAAGAWLCLKPVRRGLIWAGRLCKKAGRALLIRGKNGANG